MEREGDYNRKIAIRLNASTTNTLTIQNQAHILAQSINKHPIITKSREYYIRTRHVYIRTCLYKDKTCICKDKTCLYKDMPI